MQSTGSSKKPERLDLRGPAALAGLLLLISGQIRIASDVMPSAPPTKLAVWLTDKIHLAIPTIDNVLNGLPYLAAGALLLFFSLRKLRLLPAETPLPAEIAADARALRALWPWLAGSLGLFAILLWQINRLDDSGIMVAEWMIAPLLALIAAAAWDRQREVNLSPRIGRADLQWMLGLFLLTLVIGVYRLQGLPDSLMGDEGSFWTAARDIAKGQIAPPVFANGVYTFPVLSSVGQAWALRLFGVDLWGWRFSSVLAGALTVFPLYLLARDAFDRKVAVAANFALAFSPYFLAFARLGYNNIQALFITTLALYWLYLGARRYSMFYLLLAGCAAGFGFYTYFAARTTIVIALLFIAALWLTRRMKFRHAVLAGLLLMLGLALTAGPHFAYNRIHDPNGAVFKIFESLFFNTFNGRLFFSEEELTEVAPLFKIANNELFYHPRLYLILLARGLLRTLLVFQKPWLISEHFIASPLAGTIGVIFYLVGGGAMFKRLKEPRGLLMGLWFVVVIFSLSILNTVPPRHTHMVNIIPLLALFIGIGANILTNACAAALPRLARRKSSLLALSIAVFSLGGFYDYFVRMPARYAPQPDQIISWASLYARDEKLIYLYENQEDAERIHPYITTEFRPDISYESIPLTTFLADLQTFAGEGKTILFYPPQLAEKVEPVLANLWDERLIRRRFYNPDGIPLLSAGLNTPFTFERDRTVGQVLTESYLRPPLLVLFAVLLMLMGLAAFLPIAWTSRLPRPIEAIARWMNAPVEAAPPEEAEEAEAVAPLPTAAAETEPPAAPPEWAAAVFEPLVEGSKTKGSSIQIHAKSVKNQNGRDIYFHIHLPALRLREDWQIRIPPLALPAPALLAACVLAAVLGQILLAQRNYLPGVLLYALGAAALIFWARRHPAWKAALPNQVRIAPKAEIALALALLAVIAFSRFYDLHHRVYGLEADETKWTAQAWLSVLLKTDVGEFATMHYKPLPVDFWVRAGFLRVFGLSFLSARIESATLSLVAVIFLYLLVRRLTASPPTALLASTLYAFSYVELNASHQALHNTTLEPWMMAGLYLLILALQEKKRWQFQAAGGVLALGMLTYETFYPTVVTALVFLFGTALGELGKRRANLRQWLPRLLVTLWPIVVVYLTFTQPYLQARHGYHFGWLQKAAANGGGLGNALEFFLRNVGLLLKSVFVTVTLDDSLLRWNGPFVSPILLPFVVIGLTYNLLHLRRPLALFLPLWYLFNILPGPILLGSVWPRVLYTSLAPLMIWAALGLWVSFAALRPWLDREKVRLATPAFAGVLAAILVSNYIIFTQRIGDPTDRVKRRELADLTMSAAAQSDLLLLPYFPAQNDSVELENHVIFFSVGGAKNAGLEAVTFYQQVPYDELLLALWQNRDQGAVSVIFDKSALSLAEERRQVMNTVRACYPQAELAESGRFFDVYRLEAAGLESPRCYQAPPPQPVSPAAGAQFPAGATPVFEWSNPVGVVTGARLTIEQKSPNTYWIEAEEVFLQNGWYSASEFASGFTGSGFLLDNWQAGTAEYTLDIEQAGEYTVWVRSFKRRVNDQQNYLVVNGEVRPFAGNENVLNEWVWESVGTFDLPAGPAALALSRVYGQDEQYSVFIDAILLTPDPNQQPGEATLWKPAFSADLSDSATRFAMTEPLAAGQYRWSVRVFDGERLIDSWGERGISMPAVEFSVLP